MEHAASPSIAPTMGAYFLGIIISIFLVGIATLQTWNYFTTYLDDSLSLKTLVGVVYGLEFVQSVFLVHSIYTYVILGFGNYKVLQLTVWSLETSIILTGVIALIVQSFFCVRVYRITENRFLGLVCWALAASRFGFTASIAAHAMAAGSFAVVADPSFKRQVVASLCLGAASDVAVAACLCTGLARRRSGFQRTDRIVEKVMAFAIGSGLVTSVVAILELITYMTLENFIWIAFFTILSKMFSNSLLVSLNQRNAIRTESLKSGQAMGRNTNTRVTFGTQPRANLELDSVNVDIVRSTHGDSWHGHSQDTSRGKAMAFDRTDYTPDKPASHIF